MLITTEERIEFAIDQYTESFRKKYAIEYAEQRIAELQTALTIPEATEAELDHLFGVVR